MSGKANSLLNKISIQRKQKYIFEDSFFSKYNKQEPLIFQGDQGILILLDQYLNSDI